MIQIEKLHPEKMLVTEASPLRACASAITILKKQNKSFVDFDEFAGALMPYLRKGYTYATKDPDKYDLEYLEKVLKQIMNDPIFIEVALIVQSVLGNKKTNYYVVQKEFFEQFQKVNLDSIRFKDLAEGTGYILLPYPVIDDDGTKYTHIYFYCGEGENFCQIRDFRSKSLKYEKGKKLLEIAFVSNPNADELGNMPIERMSEGYVRSLGCRFPLNDNMSVSDLFADSRDTKIYPSENSWTNKELGFPDYAKTVVNMLAYIASGSPDIRDFRNMIKFPGERKKPVRKSNSLCTLDVKLVGYNWKKDIIKNYSAGSWEVSGHFRWQRYGYELSLVKLIWIDPHEKSWKTPKGENI